MNRALVDRLRSQETQRKQVEALDAALRQLPPSWQAIVVHASANGQGFADSDFGRRAVSIRRGIKAGILHANLTPYFGRKDLQRLAGLISDDLS